MSESRWVAWALRSYPRAWRDRYEGEVHDLALELMHDDGRGQGQIAVGLLCNAPRAWLMHRPTMNGRHALAAGATALLAGVALLVALITSVNPAASAPFRVTSGAMEPALKLNQVVQVKQLASSAPIMSGEILVLRVPPDENCGGGAVGKYLVKRVVGLPGQTISISDGYVFINGARLKEPWLPTSERGVTFPGPAGPTFSLTHPYVVPSRSYYVLGDNRDDSCDSRYWGPVPRSLVYGVVDAVH
jgi:signal peptidase I